MKILRKIQSKAIVLGMALFLLVFSLFSGVQFLRVSAENNSNESEIVYIDTEVEGIAYVQHPTCVFFGFRLTESDYDDFGLWETDYMGTPTYAAYEKYIATDLTYWKDFAKNNSEEVYFDQLYAYWHGSSVGPANFANTVAHRSTLERLEYGFIISIPKGTTFPSATYVNGKCAGSPIMYRTTEDKAFYYDGTNFSIFPYEVAQSRNSATEEFEKIDYALYYEAERKEVELLVEEAKENLVTCFTNIAVQDVMSEFYSELDKITSIADYEVLETKKQEAKIELSSYFDGFLQEDYNETNWNAILKIKNEYSVLIESAKNISEVNAAVTSVKLATEKVLKKDEQPAFEEYQSLAMERVENSFVESLYREEERAQGVALVQEAKEKIGNAETYDAVDGWEAEYLLRIDQLKTQAEWEEEERKQESEDSVASDSLGQDEQEQSSQTESKEKLFGCMGSVNQIEMVFGIMMIVMPMVIRNKKRTGNENED